MSLPSRECGLKLDQAKKREQLQGVTPFAGVWIEILSSLNSSIVMRCHSLRGSVD